MIKIINSSPTPNINAMKFTVNDILTEKGITIKADNPSGHPIGEEIMKIGGLRQVFILKDFITVTKEDDTQWEDVLPKVELAIERQA